MDEMTKEICTEYDGKINKLESRITELEKEIEQHKAITEAAKFLVKVKRYKDIGGAWYSALWPIALRKIEEAVAGLKDRKDG